MSVFSSWIWWLGRCPSEKFKIGQVLGVWYWWIRNWGPECLNSCLCSWALLFILDIFLRTQLSFLWPNPWSWEGQALFLCRWHQNVTTCSTVISTWEFVLAWILLFWFSKTNTLKLSAAQYFDELKSRTFYVPGCHSMFYISLFKCVVCIFRK